MDFNADKTLWFCNVCKQGKPLTEFYRRTSNNCGYTRKCKQCFAKELEDKRRKAKYKKCKECGEIKPVENFHKSNTHDGYYPYCNDCIKRKNSEYYKKYAQENVPEVIERKDKENPFKRCSDCRNVKSKKEFPINIYNKDGHLSFCFECEQKRNQRDYEKYLSMPEGEYEKRRKRRNEIAKMSNEEAILICYNHYCNGDIKCANPFHKHDNEPERDMELLVIDHINGDGYKDVNPGGSRIGGAALARKLIKNGFPDGYQILCMNCNWKKRHVNKEYLSGKAGIGKKQVKYRTPEELNKIRSEANLK